MSNQPESKETQDTAPEADQSRRKFTSAGVAGTGVLLSVASRSAMGGWGHCTGSELASGNLSKEGEANPCGCSPGYWWNNNGSQSWDLYLATKYPKSKTFNEVFDINYFTDTNVQIGDKEGIKTKPVTFSGCANANTIAKHAVAALLNAEFYGNRYPVLGLQSATNVIAAVKTAFNSANKCVELTAFKDRVDIYTTASVDGTWCFGSSHGASSNP